MEWAACFVGVALSALPGFGQSTRPSGTMTRQAIRECKEALASKCEPASVCW